MTSIDPAEVAAHAHWFEEWDDLPLDERSRLRDAAASYWAEVEVIRAALEQAWDEGLDAGRDRWMDAREFGAAPVNPYTEGDGQ